jgi:hypothetical protein
MIFYANSLANAEVYLIQYRRRLQRESESLKLTQSLLESCRPIIPDKFSPGFGLWLKEASDSVILGRELSQALEFGRRRSLYKLFFIIGKKEIGEGLAALAEKRVHLEGVCQGVITRYRNSTPKINQETYLNGDLASLPPRFINKKG